MGKVVLFPEDRDLNVVIEFTDKHVLDKHLFSSVPPEYSSIIYIDERAVARLESTDEINLLKYVGKQYKNRNTRLAFVRKNKLPDFDWGFGEIQVKNSKLDEAYRVGAHGKCRIKLLDAIKLIKSFGTSEVINFEKIEAMVKPMIVALGKPILSKYFADTNVSVFEITSLTNELRKTLIDALNSEKSIVDLGIAIDELTVGGIHVPDEDIELIRNRINKGANSEVVDLINGLKQEMLEVIEQSKDEETIEEIQNLREEVSKIAENQNTDTVLDEIDNLRKEFEEAKMSNSQVYMDALKKMIKDIEKTLGESMDGKLEAIKSMIESSYNEKAQDKLPLYEKAKDEVLRQLKLTTDIMLEKAETDDDFAGVAGILFSNIENNLINKFNVPHAGKDFYLTLDEFNQYIGKLNPEVKYPFKPRFIKVKGFDDGTVVEMPVEIRFMKAGLDQNEAIKAAKDWSLLNKFRHRSEENTQSLNDILNKLGYSKKEYLKVVVNKFRELKLYDRD